VSEARASARATHRRKTHTVNKVKTPMIAGAAEKTIIHIASFLNEKP
jgi:hypothetical protein